MSLSGCWCLQEGHMPLARLLPFSVTWGSVSSGVSWQVSWSWIGGVCSLCRGSSRGRAYEEQSAFCSACCAFPSALSCSASILFAPFCCIDAWRCQQEWGREVAYQHLFTGND